MRIIIVGFGTVGQAFTRILNENESFLLKNHGFRPIVIAVVDRGGAAISPRGLNFKELYRCKTAKGSVAFCSGYGRPEMCGLEVIEDLEAEVVVEVTTTNIEDGEPGLSNIETALKNKRHVITTNKAPLALAMPALLELASYNNVFFKFTGTVGGGTGFLDLGQRFLMGDRIVSIKGILNGTTNYVLTKMTDHNQSMRVALKEAQEIGYAEADPTYDVEGIDAACKLVIMANWLMNRHHTLKDVDVSGIAGVTMDDVKDAKKRGEAIKLICSIDEKSIEVKPRYISTAHPLCVNGTLNAVTFKMEYAGEITIIGHGAGGVETAGAVLRDLIDIRRGLFR